MDLYEKILSYKHENYKNCCINQNRMSWFAKSVSLHLGVVRLCHAEVCDFFWEQTVCLETKVTCYIYNKLCGICYKICLS